MSNDFARVWVLGAADPEMVAIERLLRECGEEVQYAVGPDGQRVHPGNAYKTILPQVDCDTAVYLVECGSNTEPVDIIRVDHHRPGDPGFGLPPAEYFRGSSLGQTIMILAHLGALPWSHAISGDYHDDTGLARHPDGYWVFYWADGRYYRWDVPHQYLIVAAADHCLGDAYRSECPHVDPGELMVWRAESRAAFQRRPVADVLADVKRARAALRTAPRVGSWSVKTDPETGELVPVSGLASWPIADLRGQTIPELPEAACQDDIPYLATVKDRDGREKVTLGAASPELVRHFMAGDIIPGLTNCYGDPARGFAGGYVV